MSALVCFAVFLAGVAVCLHMGWALIWAMLLGIAAFGALGLRRGFSLRTLWGFAWGQGRKMCSLLVIYVLIGMITALWRSAGTIAWFIYHGLQIITPQLFILVTFALTCFLSYALGTSFGVVGTAGIILMSLARSGGVSTAVTAGAIVAGAYFGDRCSPASSSASLVAAATGTKLEENLCAMHRTGWLPLLLSAAVYAVLSAAHPIAAVDGAMLGELAQAFDLSLWTVLPALLILVLPLCRVPVRWSMAASVAAAFLVTVAQQRMPALQALRAALLGYAGPEGALREILSGGGVISMFTASVLAIATGLYAGLLSGIGALDGIREMVERAVRRAGLYPTCAGVCLLCAMMFCNQSTAPVVAPQLMAHSYEARGEGKRALALDIENSGIVLAALIPWNISVSIPLAMLGAGASALPYAVLLYIIPLCYLVTRRRFGPRAEKEKI